MTATPISLKDKDKDKAIKNGIDFYSMDDEKVLEMKFIKLHLDKQLTKDHHF